MSIMLAQMGLSFTQGLTDFMQAKEQARYAEAVQKYRNTMSALSASRSYNAVTVNEIRAQDALTENDALIQRTAIKDQAAAKLAAAAAGVAGGSVDLAMRDLKASAGRASWAQRRQYNQQLAEMGDQRESIAIAKIANQDISVIPKPDIGSMMLGTATKMLSIWDSHKPPGAEGRLDMGARTPTL